MWLRGAEQTMERWIHCYPLKCIKTYSFYSPKPTLERMKRCLPQQQRTQRTPTDGYEKDRQPCGGHARSEQALGKAAA